MKKYCYKGFTIHYYTANGVFKICHPRSDYYPWKYSSIEDAQTKIDRLVRNLIVV